VATGDQRGIEYLHEALKFLDPVKEPVATANALSNEARFHHLAGRHRAAIDLLKRAADLVAPTAAADEVSSFAAPIISNIYAYLSGAYQHYGLYHDSNDWARTAIEFGERRNVSFAQAILNHENGITHYCGGSLAVAGPSNHRVFTPGPIFPLLHFVPVYDLRRAKRIRGRHRAGRTIGKRASRRCPKEITYGAGRALKIGAGTLGQRLLTRP
jgi:hypothetical protein